MTVKEFKKALEEVPEDAIIHISNVMVISEKEEIMGRIDAPILGYAWGPIGSNDVELCFCLDKEAINTFKNFKFIEENNE